jgi:hypothetical protein
MTQAKAIMVLVIGLTLMSSGCASLRPPAGDKEAREAQQRQEEVRRESDPLGESLYWAVVLGEFSAALAGVK